jgi:hypothetical protein
VRLWGPRRLQGVNGEVRARFQLAKGGVETAHWEKAVAAMPALKPARVARCPVPETGLMS